MSYRHGFTESWTLVKCLDTGTGTTTLVAAPGPGRRLRVQGLMVCVTTAAAQAFDIESSSGAVEVFKAKASQEVGAYPVDPGPLGFPLPADEALQYTATAGVGLTVSGFGWVEDHV